MLVQVWNSCSAVMGTTQRQENKCSEKMSSRVGPYLKVFQPATVSPSTWNVSAAFSLTGWVLECAGVNGWTGAWKMQIWFAACHFLTAFALSNYLHIIIAHSFYSQLFSVSGRVALCCWIHFYFDRRATCYFATSLPVSTEIIRRGTKNVCTLVKFPQFTDGATFFCTSSHCALCPDLHTPADVLLLNI